MQAETRIAAKVLHHSSSKATVLHSCIADKMTSSELFSRLKPVCSFRSGHRAEKRCTLCLSDCRTLAWHEGKSLTSMG